MKKNRLFMMGTLAVMLAFGLVLAGCSTDADEDDPNNPNNPGGGGLTLADFVGTYNYIGAGSSVKWVEVTESGNTLTISHVEDDLFAEEDYTPPAPITGVTLEYGGTTAFQVVGNDKTGTWYYLVKAADNGGTQKIGTAISYFFGGDTLEIHLGRSWVESFGSTYNVNVNKADIIADSGLASYYCNAGSK